MKLVKVSSVLIEQLLQTGSTHKFKILEGIPEGDKLQIVKLNGSMVDLYFSESTDKQVQIKAETIYE